jgi:hypothetical protein
MQISIENQYFSNAERHLGCRPHNHILALQNWHFSNANQHLIIEYQYFSIAERHLYNNLAKPFTTVCSFSISS